MGRAIGRFGGFGSMWKNYVVWHQFILRDRLACLRAEPVTREEEIGLAGMATSQSVVSI
jgi:hypothetical protein